MSLKFKQIAFIVQMPHLNLLAEAEKAMGRHLLLFEEDQLKKREIYVRRWLEYIATEDDKFKLAEMNSPVPLYCSEEQKFLNALKIQLVKTEWKPETIQKIVFDVAKQFENLSLKKSFAAIYKLYFNRTSGPIVGWFLSALDKQYVISRLELVEI